MSRLASRSISRGDLVSSKKEKEKKRSTDDDNDDDDDDDDVTSVRAPSFAISDGSRA